MRTAGPLLADTPNTDLQLFLPATDAIVANAAVASFPVIEPQGGAGTTPISSILIPASASTQIQFNLSKLFVRTGILQSNNFATNTMQQAFGTANGPGPSLVEGTSDPSGFGYDQGIPDGDNVIAGSNTLPPIQSQLLPTLLGPFPNALPKGIRIKWIDLIYVVNGVALTSLGLELVNFTFGSGHDVPIQWNGGYSDVNLPSAALAINSTVHKAHRERCLITDLSGNPTTQFLTVDGTLLTAVLIAVTPAGSTVNLLGIILGCDFNFN
jgi:hypothetical protein